MNSGVVSSKPKKVLDGVYQLKLPLPSSELVYLLSYLVEGRDGYLLVDSGWNTTESFCSLEEQLSRINVNLSDISLVLVTHLHPDHYGLADRIRKESGSKVLMHQKTEEILKHFKNIKNYFDKMIEWLKINGSPAGELEDWIKASIHLARLFKPARADIFLQDGEIINLGDFQFDVIWVPGHSPDHICLYESSRKILLSGDHILPTITPNVSLQIEDFGNPLKDYLESLKKLCNLKVKKVLPAHEYIFENLEKRISEIEEHHKKRLEEVLNTINTPKTAYQIAQEIIWTTGPWNKLQKWEQRAAIFEALAHLVFLKYEGRILEIKQNQTIFFQKISRNSH